eukprot:1643328-Rhodomonas_salina.1
MPPRSLTSDFGTEPATNSTSSATAAAEPDSEISRATEKEQLGAAKPQKRDNKLAKTDDFLWKDIAAMKARLDTHAK